MTTLPLDTWGSSFDWFGFPARQDKLLGFTLKIIRPPVEKPGRPWIWKTEFVDAFPEADIELVRHGFHLVNLDVPDHFGSPKAVAYGDALYDLLTTSLGFSSKVSLLGLSRGGLWAYNWAAAHPERVSLIFGDNPVCDFKSWPGGLGIAPGNPASWQKCLDVYGLSESEAKAWPHNPVDSLQVLAQANIPILHVVGDADDVVPLADNSDLIRDRYRVLGGTYEEVVKPGGKHHPHGLPGNPGPIVDFFERFAG